MNGENFASQIFKLFDLKWKLIIYPNGINKYDKRFVNIVIENISLKEETSMIVKVMYFEWIVFVKETKTNYITTEIFTNNNYTQSWDKGRMLTKTMKDLNKCTIDVTIKLINIETLKHTQEFLSITTDINELTGLINADLSKLFELK